MEDNRTQVWENGLWELDGSENDVGEKVLEFLQKRSGKAAFGARLSRFIAEECGISESGASQYLKDRCRAEGIDINPNTVRNWFSKAGPKKGEHSRDLMLRVAFALHLNVEQTNRLFQKVYLDRGLYPRRLEEYTAEFCLKEGLSWTVWQSLLKQYPSAEGTDEQTVYTRVLQQNLDDIKTSDELKEYWKRHFYNFTVQNKSAREVLQDLIQKVKGNAEKTGEVDREIAERPDWSSILNTGPRKSRGNKDADLNEERRRPHDTNEAMVCVITDIDPKAKNGNKGKRSIIKDTCLPSEIRTNFPEASVFSKKNPSFEELRKMIILLGSYYLWRQAKRTGKMLELDAYIQEMNDRLNTAGLPPLYYGNPFDWLFLFSAKEDNPLDCFREILAEAMEDEEL
ncbi:hypothetical protein B5E65_05400 [Gemmiger sp. An120]|uniref:hypothetical protein n=1 Tax=Gemmiger sp. An120 TaxID=1965549 RepID=UPI000B369D2F|nr:hypothetical protein [Gemmiger sp. An120]OUQ43211.1 hypothetical protein B5E65_05400 [Gemmiger sp. An120]